MGLTSLRRAVATTVLLACTLASGVLVAGAAGADTAGSTAAATATAATADGTVDIRVGTFNVRSVRLDGNGTLPWRDRRPAVVRDILGERVDVLGVQELSQSPNFKDHLEDGPNQMLDLVAGLKAAGGNYALTDTEASTSRDTRILYNVDALTLLSNGAYRYAVQSGGPNDARYLVWATFQVRATGHEFFFATTHLVNNFADLQREQTRELIDEVNRLRGSLPVVVAGDFQRSKKREPMDFTLPAMQAAGYGDVLGQAFQQPYAAVPRAETRINGWINTMNYYDRDVRRYAFETNRQRYGNNIDWIFASNELPVRAWKVVARYHRQHLYLTGVIPSDHFMVRATLTLL